MTKHAVYAIARDRAGEQVPFRIGQPVDWDTAQARWRRLDDRRIGATVPARDCTLRWARRGYKVEAFEVRAVDRHGRGLGEKRHTLAFPVPYRTLRTAKR